MLPALHPRDFLSRMSRTSRSWMILAIAMHVAAGTLAAAMPSTVRLWPAAAPGSEKITFKEKITERSTDPAKHDRIYTQIVEPSMQVFVPPLPNGIAVIVAPGGGYQRVVVDKEGLDTANWLNGLGITAFVLKYRLPDEGHENGHLVGLQDAQRAVRLVRARASEWGIDPARVGFLGYSAGGHLAATVSFHPDRPVYQPIDDADRLSARPDFSVYCYAAAGVFGTRAENTTAPQRNRLMKELAITAAPGVQYPPAFIFQADDDPAVAPEHALHLYKTLRESGAKAELHIFRRGGHGFGIRNAEGPIARWPTLCEAWLREAGILR